MYLADLVLYHAHMLSFKFLKIMKMIFFLLSKYLILIIFAYHSQLSMAAKPAFPPFTWSPYVVPWREGDANG